VSAAAAVTEIPKFGGRMSISTGHTAANLMSEHDLEVVDFLEETLPHL
jgi:hypothetical protein